MPGRIVRTRPLVVVVVVLAALSLQGCSNNRISPSATLTIQIGDGEAGDFVGLFVGYFTTKRLEARATRVRMVSNANGRERELNMAVVKKGDELTATAMNFIDINIFKIHLYPSKDVLTEEYTDEWKQFLAELQALLSPRWPVGVTYE
jgi:hypothetical protein